MGQNANLRKLAMVLKDYPSRTITYKVEYGIDLINRGEKQVDGEDIHPKSLYRVPTYLLMNHFKEMKRIMGEGGKPAVMAYVQKIGIKQEFADKINHQTWPADTLGQ